MGFKCSVPFVKIISNIYCSYILDELLNVYFAIKVKDVHWLLMPAHFCWFFSQLQYLTSFVRRESSFYIFNAATLFLFVFFVNVVCCNVSPFLWMLLTQNSCCWALKIGREKWPDPPSPYSQFIPYSNTVMVNIVTSFFLYFCLDWIHFWLVIRSLG